MGIKARLIPDIPALHSPEPDISILDDFVPGSPKVNAGCGIRWAVYEVEWLSLASCLLDLLVCLLTTPLF